MTEREEADRQLSELSRLFIQRFKERSEEFDSKDLEDMRFLCVQMVSLMLKCKEKGVRVKNVYNMLGILTSYMKVVKDVV